jgi:hypothetical protein
VSYIGQAIGGELDLMVLTGGVRSSHSSLPSPSRPQKYFLSTSYTPQGSFILFLSLGPHLFTKSHNLTTTSTAFHMTAGNHFPPNTVTKTSFVTFHPHYTLITKINKIK